MTVGNRRAIRNTAERYRDLTRSQLERAFIIQRSTTAPDVIAALVERDIDVNEIVRVARAVLAGERRAILRFSEFADDRVNSLARVLCLAGDDGLVDQGLAILRAQARLSSSGHLPLFQRLLLADALILRGHYDEVVQWLSVAGFEGTQRARYELAAYSPFRRGNLHAMPVDDWVSLFNDFMSPSGELAPVELEDDEGALPFERLAVSCSRQVEGPLVTVVMSSFRPGESVFGSIRSILNQTWSSLELLVIDDASGPEYDDIYQRVASMDTRVRVIRQKVNGGTYLIRNRAISLARGKFIGFQDNDDWSHPERIERQMEPLLADPSILATQSLCFRTDEHLDPVKIGYRKHLRRNESSLLFRVEVVRRVGFFHFTRKGGDSEFRLRLEAAFGRPTTVVGQEALAIIRLTPGSLSRDEFSPGFRHPSRFVYTECFNLVHARAEQESTFYRSVREYRDSFVPAKFQPRRIATDKEEVDVVIVADLRDCALTNAWVTSVCTTLRRRGFRVGLAHYVGLRFEELRPDRLSPEVAGLLVDGIAEPVDFGEKRAIGTVVVADAALLQHSPWQPTPWRVQHVFARRMVSDSAEDLYDDATVGFTSLRLFGVRPTWIGSEPAANTVLEVVRSHERTSSRTHSEEDLDTFVSSSQAVAFSSMTMRRFSLVVPTPVRPGPLSKGIVRAPVEVPYSASRSEVDGRWCAVIGWPVFGFDRFAEPADAATILLRAWSSGDFEQQYADLGGICIVIRGEGHDVAVRSTAESIGVCRTGDLIRIAGPETASGEYVLKGDNAGELVLPGSAPAHVIPITSPITHDGAPLDELQHMARWQVRMNPHRRISVLLDDSVPSALLVGLVREAVDDVDLVVTTATSRLAAFLHSRFVDFRVLQSDSTVDSPAVIGVGDTSSEALERLAAFGTSYRFRQLVDVVLKTPISAEILDSLWMGLGDVLHSRSRTASLPTGNLGKAGLPILRERGHKEVAEEEIVREGARALRIDADLSRNEKYPLSAEIHHGTTSRLVVSLSPARAFDGSGFPVPQPVETVSSDHHLVLADTTLADDKRVDYGWFFGTQDDNLILRYAQFVRQVKAHLDCSEVIIRGHGCAALPALFLASLLPHSTALISSCESFAGEADRTRFASLVESLGDPDPQEFIEAHAHRLRLRCVLAAAPPDLCIVVVREEAAAASEGFALVADDPRATVIDSSEDDWLLESV